MSSDLLPRFRQRGRSEAQWRAFGVTPEGARFPLEVTAVPRRPEPDNIRIVLESVLREWGVGALRAAFADLSDQARDEDDLADLGGPLPGRDPISMWAPELVGNREDRTFGVDLLELPDQNLGLTCRRATGGAPFAAAWHEDHFAVLEFPPGLSHIEVQYSEDVLAKLNRRVARDVLNRGRSFWRRLMVRTVTEVDWFCYAGENTMRSHGSEPVREGLFPRQKPMQIETGGRPGLLHLKPWQWVGSRLSKPGTDPEWLNRLGAHTRALERTGLVDLHPELAAVADYSVNDPIVWVHGTVSCGLVHLRQLLRHVPYGRTVYRFEHDTFLDIDTNIDDLVDQLARKVAADTRRITLIGHSRGGIVARGAARALAPGRPDVDFDVVTLGTPHDGTPLVNAGARVLKGLVAMTTFGIGASPIPDPASMLLKYLLRFAKLPSGIEDMGTGSGWLRGFNKGGDLEFDMLCIGADYERGLQPESAGVKALGRLRRLFEVAGSAENDLVVPMTSATACGTARPIQESSGHFEYLAKSEVETELRAIL